MWIHPSAKIQALYLTIVLIFALGGLASCKKPPPPLAQPQRIEHVHRDFSPLQGKKIVIDPGHGGRFSGAVGVRGLRESDVNLAVGLHLREFEGLHRVGSVALDSRVVVRDGGNLPHVVSQGLVGSDEGCQEPLGLAEADLSHGLGEGRVGHAAGHVGGVDGEGPVGSDQDTLIGLGEPERDVREDVE